LSRVVQTGNWIEGDNAGGNLTKHVTNYSPSNEPCPILEKLSQELASQMANSPESREIHSRLQHYQTPVQAEKVIGLEAKLQEADMLDILRRAESEKEAFTKRLAELQFFPAAQKAFVHLLSEVYSRFNHHVLPKISSGSSKEAIHIAIQEGIITPIAQKLGESPLEIYQEEINGMIFFLTGNCHIRWKPEC